MKRPARSLSLVCALAVCAGTHAHATQVRVDTPLGAFTIQMYDAAAPITVTNFLQYIADGAFDDTFIHRSLPGFVVQGGSFNHSGTGIGNVTTRDPIVNEFGASNTRGTLAMAKIGPENGGGPDTATSGWFVNLDDNGINGSLLDNLDEQNGGFTVFAEVMGDGMDVVDAIAALGRVNAGGAFTTLPLLDGAEPPTIDANEVVLTNFRIVGDATGDAYVGAEDLDLLLANWGETVGAYDFAAGDFSGDGLVGAADLAIVQAQFGQGLAGGANVPEPASAALLLAGGALLVRRRQRSSRTRA